MTTASPLLGPALLKVVAKMNGDDALSNLRSEMCRNADARAVGFDELSRDARTPLGNGAE